MKVRTMAMALLLLGAAAYGQTRFDVPFAFHVGDKTLTAGSYTVSTEGTGLVWLQIRSQAGRSMMVMPQYTVQAAKYPEAGKLVFNRYGDAYFLSQVWSQGNDQGKQLPKSSAEREIARAGGTAEHALIYAARR